MRITKENIEEHLFDYFEGNLADTHKTDLLEFIHLNQEFEKDFSLWAQSYALTDTSVPDYGLAQTLLKNEGFVWGKNLTLIWDALFLTSMVVVFFFYTGNMQVHTLKPKTEIPVKLSADERVSVKEVKSNSVATELKRKEQPRLMPKKELNESIVNSETVQEDIAAPISLTPKVADKDTLNIQEPKAPITKPLIKIDSTEMAPMKETPAKDVKKKKKRLPLDLKPQEKFIPVNSDF